MTYDHPLMAVVVVAAIAVCVIPFVLAAAAKGIGDKRFLGNDDVVVGV